MILYRFYGYDDIIQNGRRDPDKFRDTSIVNMV